MKLPQRNRLSRILEECAADVEFHYNPDPDDLGADLGIDYKGQTIIASYGFTETEDSYDFVAAFGEVEPSDLPTLAENLLKGDYVRGITERIEGDRKYVVFSGRDGLEPLSDKEVKQMYEQDVAQITDAFDLYHSLLK